MRVAHRIMLLGHPRCMRFNKKDGIRFPPAVIQAACRSL